LLYAGEPPPAQPSTPLRRRCSKRRVTFARICSSERTHRRAADRSCYRSLLRALALKLSTATLAGAGVMQNMCRWCGDLPPCAAHETATLPAHNLASASPPTKACGSARIPPSPVPVGECAEPPASWAAALDQAETAHATVNLSPRGRAWQPIPVTARGSSVMAPCHARSPVRQVRGRGAQKGGGPGAK
jgi:hypothetical protein